MRQVGVLEAVHGEAAARVGVAGLRRRGEELADSMGNGNRLADGLGLGKGVWMVAKSLWLTATD